MFSDLNTSEAFTTPVKLVSGKLHAETCLTTEKTKKVLTNLTARHRQQTELITKLENEVSRLNAIIIESKAEKERNERLLETAEAKLQFEIRRVEELEQQLESAKIRERNLMNEQQLNSEKLMRIEETFDSKTSLHKQELARVKDELLMNENNLAKVKRELRKSKTANSELLIQIQKIKQSNSKQDTAIASMEESYKRQNEALNNEYTLMMQENTQRWQNERTQLEEEFQKSNRSLEARCAEKDRLFRQKELMFEEYRVKQERVIEAMKADMEDLRLELSNQIQFNGGLKTSYESLRIGTNIKIRSMQRKIEDLKEMNFLLPSNTEDIQKIQRILSIENEKTSATERRASTPEIRQPMVINPESERRSLVLQNSPAFSSSIESTLRRKRLFEKDDWMVRMSKRRRYSRDNGKEFDFGIDESPYCSMM